MANQDHDAIEQAVQAYLDGLYEGNADKLASVFHETSALTYELRLAAVKEQRAETGRLQFTVSSNVVVRTSAPAVPTTVTT